MRGEGFIKFLTHTKDEDTWFGEKNTQIFFSFVGLWARLDFNEGSSNILVQS